MHENSDLDNEFLRACGRKRRFRKMWHAEKALWAGCEANHYDSGYHVYWCKFCNGYHIGRIQIGAPKPVSISLLRLDGYMLCLIEDGYGYIQGTKNNHYKLVNNGWEPIEKDGEKLYRKKIKVKT